MAITFPVAPVAPERTPLSSTKERATGRVLLGRLVEAWGSSSDGPCLPLRQHGLLQAVRTAFDQHYPLILTPDAIWLCIAQGFAAHVQQNAERLRGKFVRHEGQAEIRIIRDDFVKGSPDNAWPEVFTQFSDQIAEHIGRQRDLVVCDFSTTGPCERAASEIVLMDAMAKYFKYVVVTRCGIPSITLEGTVDDWRSVRRRVQALGEYELSWWVDALGPVVDQFVAAAEGRVDTAFWQSIYNLYGGSGGPFVTGWINALFPYCRRDPRQSDLRVNPWFTDDEGGDVRRSGFAEGYVPSGLSIVPFIWEYLGTLIPMELLGGFVGVVQHEETLALQPAIGWAVRDAADPVETGERDLESEMELARFGPFGPRADASRLATLPSAGDARAVLIAGRAARVRGLSMDVAKELFEVLSGMRVKDGPRLSCHVGDGSMVVGVEVAHTDGAPSLSDPVTDVTGVIDRLRNIPPNVWSTLSSVIPGGLEEEVALHLYGAAAVSTLVLGERIAAQEGEHIYVASKQWSAWAVRGVKVAEVRAGEGSHARVAVSTESEAKLRSQAAAAGAVGGMAYYLIAANG
ncbi:MAG: DUF4419 domain-containing protein [Minicystis sp.]